jgi:hypothetical protein
LLQELRLLVLLATVVGIGLYVHARNSEVAIDR